MKNEKVTIQLPLGIAKWLLFECDFHQEMLRQAVSDLDCVLTAPSVKRPLVNDYCNYGVVHHILSKSLYDIVRK